MRVPQRCLTIIMWTFLMLSRQESSVHSFYNSNAPLRIHLTLVAWFLTKKVLSVSSEEKNLKKLGHIDIPTLNGQPKWQMLWCDLCLNTKTHSKKRCQIQSHCMKKISTLMSTWITSAAQLLKRLSNLRPSNVPFISQIGKVGMRMASQTPIRDLEQKSVNSLQHFTMRKVIRWHRNSIGYF